MISSIKICFLIEGVVEVSLSFEPEKKVVSSLLRYILDHVSVFCKIMGLSD